MSGKDESVTLFIENFFISCRDRAVCIGMAGSTVCCPVQKIFSAGQFSMNSKNLFYHSVSQFQAIYLKGWEETCVVRSEMPHTECCEAILYTNYQLSYD